MFVRSVVGGCAVVLLSAVAAGAAGSEVADAVMKRNREAARSLLQRKADVNAPQIDGTTALHWAVRLDDLDTADMLIRAGAAGIDRRRPRRRHGADGAGSHPRLRA